MIQPSDIHTLTEFKRDSKAVLERMESSGRPQVLTVDGRAKAVVLGIEAFERMAELVDRAEALEGIRRGLEDMKAGRTMSLAEGEAELRKRIGLPPKKGSKSL